MTDMLFRAVVKAVLVTAFLALLTWNWPHRDIDPDAVRQQSGNTVLFDHRDECWTFKQPEDVDVPTHVIMRVEGGVSGSDWFYGGSKWVDIALADVFTHDNPRVYVVAFCR